MTKRCGRDLLRELATESCTRPQCDGSLDREQYKGTDAVVCADCGTPTLRLWEA